MKQLGGFRRTVGDNPLQHVSVEIKGIELLQRIRATKGKHKDTDDSMHPKVAELLKGMNQR